MNVLGLTGGIACGKSTATQRFQERKIPVIDTDLVAKQLLTHHPDIQAKVLKSFGTCNRSELRKIIFGHETQRRKLEEILHPEIYRVVQERLRDLEKAKPKPKLVLVVVPLLYEAGWEPFFNSTIAIICKEERQIQRLASRDQTPTDLATKMIHSQLPNSEKSRRADFTLENNSDLPSFQKEIDQLIDKLETLS